MLSQDDHSTTASLPSISATEGAGEITGPWLMMAGLWALIIAVFGSIGNFLTALTIIHQIVLQRRRQNMYSQSDSCLHLKIIKEKENSSVSLQTIDKFNLNHTTHVDRSFSLSPCPSNVSAGNPSSPNEALPPTVERLKQHNSLSTKLALIERNSLPFNFVFNQQYLEESRTERPFDEEIPLRKSYVVVKKGVTKVASHGDPVNVHSKSSSPNSKGSRETSPIYASSASSVTDKNFTQDETTINVDPYSPSIIEKGSLSTSSSQILYKKHHGHPCPAESTLSVRSQISSQCRPDHSGTGHPSVMHVEGDTLLLLHVIICDFLYCIISLPHSYYVYGFTETEDIKAPTLCAEAAFFRYVNAFAEWLTLGLLTLQRCVDLAKPPNARFFRFKSTLSFVAATWVFSIFLQLGNLINGNFGYNKSTHKCDIVGPMTSKLYFYTLDTFLPSGLMLFGCVSIISQIVRNKRRLQRFGMSSEIVAQREKEMWQSAFLILSLLFLYLICVIPICVYNVLFTLDTIKSEEAGIAVYMIYWVQYGLNFIAYGTRRSQFRKAFKVFFIMIFDKIKYCCHLTELENKVS